MRRRREEEKTEGQPGRLKKKEAEAQPARQEERVGNQEVERRTRVSKSMRRKLWWRRNRRKQK